MWQHSRRRASMYVVVMSTAMLITLIGLAALNLSRVEQRSTGAIGDLGQARLLAQSAIEMGIYWVDRDSNWRSTYPNGTWTTGESVGNGSFTLQGLDATDGNLANSNTDPLRLVATGFKDDAQYNLQVTLTAEIRGLTCLKSDLHAGANLTFTAATVQSDNTLSANSSVSAFISDVDGAVEAVGTITGWTYNSSTTPGVDPREMPDASALSYYVSNATPISYTSLPIGGTGRVMENVVLSAAANPYGAALGNVEGIYYINCAGLDITIRNSRIAGTLVLENPGSGSTIEGSVNWEPAVSNYPTLLVNGNMTVQTDGLALSEADLGVNFNPIGSPYQGSENVDLADTYPSEIGGLTYVSGDLSTRNAPSFAGVVVAGGSASVTDALNLAFDGAIYNNPPPGFQAPPKMVISPGSWQQIVN